MQNVSNPVAGAYGSINKINVTDDGRVIYSVIDAKGKDAGKLSVPQNQADVFEKSYHQIMDNAPALQKFAEEHQSEESLKSLKKKASRITLISTLAGSCTGIFGASKLKIHNTWAQIGITAVTSILGLFVGRSIAANATMPKGVRKFNEATHNLSKLDIQKA